MHCLRSGWLPVCNGQQKTLAWLSEGCLCHRSGPSISALLIGGASAKVNPESVLSGTMVLGLAGPMREVHMSGSIGAVLRSTVLVTFNRAIAARAHRSRAKIVSGHIGQKHSREGKSGYS